MVRLKPGMPEAYLARGGSLHALGQHDRGLADRTEAIRLNPDLAEAWCARGSAYYLLGKYEFAVVDLKQALRLQPAYKEASDVLKLTEERIAHLSAEDRAKQAAAPLTTREVERVPVPVSIAAAEPVVTGPVAPKLAPVPRKRESVAVAEPPKAAVATKPASAEAHHLRGRQLTTAGKYAEAIQELSAAIQMKPELAPAYNARGYAYILTQQYAKAIADLDVAIRINSTYVNAFQNRGWAKKNAGDAIGAKQDWDLAKKLGGQ